MADLWTILGEDYEPLVKHVDNNRVTGASLTWNSAYGGRTATHLFRQIDSSQFTGDGEYYWNAAGTPGHAEVTFPEPTDIDAMVWQMNRSGEYCTVRYYCGSQVVRTDSLSGRTDWNMIKVFFKLSGVTKITIDLSGASWYSWNRLLFYKNVIKTQILVSDDDGVKAYGGGYGGSLHKSGNSFSGRSGH